MCDLFISRLCTEDCFNMAVEALDVWADAIPFSPIKSFSRQTTFISAIEHSAYELELESQFEDRKIKKNEKPYSGQKCAERANDKSNDDLWNLDFSHFLDFQSHSNTFVWEDSKEIAPCYHCATSGYVSCSGCGGGGKDRCPSCRGRGYHERSVEREHMEACNFCRGMGHTMPGRTCTACAGSGRRNVKNTEKTHEPCGECAASGKIECRTCSGSGRLKCADCGGSGRLLLYLSAEQREWPIKTTHACIAGTLPEFSKQNSPISKIAGDVVFTDEIMGEFLEFNFPAGDACSDLISLAKAMRPNQSGRVLRQRLAIRRCGIVGMAYKFEECEYHIFVNILHGLVEDMGGPISSHINQINERAISAYKSGQLENAFRLNLQSICMDEATPEEKSLRDCILKKLFETYAAIAGVVFVVLASIFSHCDTYSINGLGIIILGVALIYFGVWVFARDMGLYLSKSQRWLSATMIGIVAFQIQSTSLRPWAPIQLSQNVSRNAVDLTSPFTWQEFGILAISVAFPILLGLWTVLKRNDNRRKTLAIESFKDCFPNAQSLEQFIKRLEPSTKYGAVVLCLMIICFLLPWVGGTQFEKVKCQRLVLESQAIKHQIADREIAQTRENERIQAAEKKMAQDAELVRMLAAEKERAQAAEMERIQAAEKEKYQAAERERMQTIERERAQAAERKLVQIAEEKKRNIADRIGTLTRQLADVNENIERERKRWQDAVDTINRLTNFKRTPVVDGSPAYYKCLEAARAAQEVERKAPDLKTEKENIEKLLNDLKASD